MSNLYTILAEYEVLLNKDEYTDKDIKDIENYNDDIIKKVIYIVHHIKNIEHELNGVKNAIQSMRQREESLSNKKDKLRKLVSFIMDRAKINSIKDSPYFKILLVNNPDKVDNYDNNIIPRDYWERKETYILNKELIKHDLEKGIDVPGCKLTRDVNVRIK